MPYRRARPAALLPFFHAGRWVWFFRLPSLFVVIILQFDRPRARGASPRHHGVHEVGEPHFSAFESCSGPLTDPSGWRDTMPNGFFRFGGLLRTVLIGFQLRNRPCTTTLTALNGREPGRSSRPTRRRPGLRGAGPCGGWSCSGDVWQLATYMFPAPSCSFSCSHAPPRMFGTARAHLGPRIS